MATGFSAADGLGRYLRFERNKCSSVRASRVVGSACACQEQMKQGKVCIFETLTTSNLDHIFFIFTPSVLTTNPRDDEAVMLGNAMPLTGQFLPEVSGLHIRASHRPNFARQAGSKSSQSTAIIPTTPIPPVPAETIKKTTQLTSENNGHRHSFRCASYVKPPLLRRLSADRRDTSRPFDWTAGTNADMQKRLVRR